ncbi:hypothetical protein QTI99_05125 [Clostridium perfringens]|uniref:hypothetical protein n=2 Tax=Clostridium perfringens TaxID=1502 RepID=UPI00290BD7F8|nr:hypothetical protein [Clostridium perfringens]EJT6169479.1 hypothetical protein [Clostridium perfringens]MBS5995871.1 hypothetical protein [Clostridium perfringens]MDM0996840.1 hypothetical protein [Clostridium perfringens]MDU5660620.1 hypothetical protein [Clostridium perfringens]WVH94684.1 hypothetical protein V0I27_07775 [Clostridium perfringens]
MLVKEYEVKICENKEENKVLYNSSNLNEKFLNLYNHIKIYEKENKLLIMTLKLREYIENLKLELKSLENCANSNGENNKINSFLRKSKREFKEIYIKINSINKDDSKALEEELIDEVLLNLKYKLLESIKEYNEELNRDYLYHNQLRVDFGIQCNELKNKFLEELKTYLESSSKRIKENINLKSRVVLKEIKLTSKEDINLEVVDIIKNDILELSAVNEEIFNIYRKHEKEIHDSFFESLNKLGIKESEEHDSYKCEKVDYTSLNKRFFKLIEFFNKGFLKNKILMDIEKFIGHENIENKMEIELLYALDLFKEEYIKSIEGLILNLKERLEENIYSNFESDYGKLFSVEDQSEILNNMYLNLKNVESNNFNKITLVDYLNNSKRSKRYT